MEISLKRFEKSHIQKTYEFIQYPNVSKFFARSQVVDWETHCKYWENSLADNTQVSYAIYFRDNHIGNCGIKKIFNGSGEIWKYIAEKEYLHKGYGKLVSKLLLKECFETFGLNKVYSVTDISNKINLSLNSKLGFKKVDFSSVDELYWGKEISHLLKFELTKEDFYNTGGGVMISL